MTMAPEPNAPPRAQRGSTLLIVIVLLLLATVLTMFALSVGTFEQRTSGNDLRIRLVKEVTDSAISQGIEALNADPDLADLDNWELCAANDTTFPCGSVPQLTSTGAARRATMYRYVGGTFDVFGDGAVDAMDERMLPLDRRIATVNSSAAGADDGFEVQYGVGAVMCRLLPAAVGQPATCTTDETVNTRVNAYTFVAVGAMGDESARTTAVKTVVSYTTPGLSSDTPPILASGTIDLTGTLQVVTNPNSGGPGVPISVWTRKNTSKTGTPNTCYADEFFRLGAKNNSPPTLYPAGADADDQTLTCDNCSCPGDATLSFSDSGGACGEGMDILDIDNDACGVNKDVKPEEFPCDLFQHVFGVPAYTDNNNDYFCETLILADDPKSNASPPPQIGADEAFLLEEYDYVIAKASDPYLASFQADGDKLITCDDLDETLSGIVWDRSGACGDGSTIGSPGAPVIFVSDGSPSFQNLKLFGVLYVRSTGPGPLNAATGGNASLRINAGTVIYGSAVVQGVVEKANGTAAVIHDAKVLANLGSSNASPTIAGLPGSWTDIDRY